MRRVIRKRIRRKEDGLDLAVDFNADIAVNVGRSNARTVAGAEKPAEDDEPPEQTATRDTEQEGKEP
jgi:hypothetical protein